MAREFRLPELAESVVEGEIVQWLVAEGERVSADQPLVEVMTDKVTVELPSPFSGTLQKQLVAEGDIVPVDNPIALFSDEGVDDAEETGDEGAGQASTSLTTSSTTSEDSAAKAESEAESEDAGERLSLFRPSKEETDEPVFRVRAGPAPAEPARGPYGRVLAVPAARKLARELGLDVAAVPGSGPNGRVRVADVEAYAAQLDAPTSEKRAGNEGVRQTERPLAPTSATGSAAGSATGSAAGSATGSATGSSYTTAPQYAERETRQPVRGLRRAIAKQMVASHLQSVRTLHVDEADVSELVALRQRLKPLADRRGVKLSYLPLIAKATVAALKAFPVLNASLNEVNNELVIKHYYNLGLAVATDAGLIVPVIKDADRKSILDIAAEVQTLARKARDGKLGPEDTRHGTFSLTNIGSFGGLFSFPIINVPEAAILGIHSIKKRPVVLEDDSIVARQMLYLSLSFDHRVVDGAEAAQFTSYLIDLLETPEALLLEA
ncbi:MAG: dihydrolipoamide acetyltransferase family protein [Trueperaceae bacterium]|nr:dihydrolipoamide acetyltransferase family protein [Trueperaceae bacterium]